MSALFESLVFDIYSFDAIATSPCPSADARRIDFRWLESRTYRSRHANLLFWKTWHAQDFRSAYDSACSRHLPICSILLCNWNAASPTLQNATTTRLLPSTTMKHLKLATCDSALACSTYTTVASSYEPRIHEQRMIFPMSIDYDQTLLGSVQDGEMRGYDAAGCKKWKTTHASGRQLRTVREEQIAFFNMGEAAKKIEGRRLMVDFLGKSQISAESSFLYYEQFRSLKTRISITPQHIWSQFNATCKRAHSRQQSDAQLSIVWLVYCHESHDNRALVICAYANFSFRSSKTVFYRVSLP